jgi:hypothetical protein
MAARILSSPIERCVGEEAKATSGGIVSKRHKQVNSDLGSPWTLPFVFPNVRFYVRPTLGYLISR